MTRERSWSGVGLICVGAGVELEWLFQICTWSWSGVGAARSGVEMELELTPFLNSVSTPFQNRLISWFCGEKSNEIDLRWATSTPELELTPELTLSQPELEWSWSWVFVTRERSWSGVGLICGGAGVELA